MSAGTVTCYRADGGAVEVARVRVVPRPSVYGVAFTDDRGQVLLTRNRHAPAWELPGGGVATGERAAEALVREFQEEVGLAVRVDVPVYFADSFFYPDEDGVGWHALKLFYLVHSGGTLNPPYEESRAGGNYGAAWVPVDELDGIDLRGDHYDAVQRALHWLETTEGPAAGDDDRDDDD